MTLPVPSPPAGSPLELGGKTALVTGAGAGIGRSIALVLATAGARVVAVGYDGQSARETAACIAGSGGGASSVA
ncbi:SDR family NAD(P)-dependent oxidoreductase [Haliea sp. E17]|uniref:SDR family NAD(P)-dependent oxidoreductase n=1 Tax=Haliea sp. E17 TaxID=3401576 RepID=UPI003AAEBAE2